MAVNKKDDWVLESAETSALVAGTKTKGNESYSKTKWLKGSPSEVKAIIQMEFDGFNYEIQSIHTIEHYSREVLTATNHGTIKEHERKTLQFDSFGSCGPFNRKPSYPNGNPNNPDPKYPEDPEAGLTHKTATLKNMIDILFADKRAMWIVIVCVAVLSAVAFGMTIIK